MVALHSICFVDASRIFPFQNYSSGLVFRFSCFGARTRSYGCIHEGHITHGGRNGILVRWPQMVLALALPSQGSV